MPLTKLAVLAQAGEPGRAEDLSAELERMAAPLLRRPGWQVERLLLPGFALAVLGHQPQAALAQRDGYLLALAGEIQPPDDATQAGHSLAETLLEHYLLAGESALCGLNGSYAVLVWQESRRRLTLVTDELGLVPMTFQAVGGRLRLASELKSLLGPDLPGELNPQAVTDFLLYDHVQDERSLAHGAHRLPPAAKLTWEDGQLHTGTYWSLPFGQYHAGSASQLAHEWAEHVRTAVDRALAERSLLLVTGGLDSRIVAEAAAQARPGIPLDTASLGLPGSLDSRLGAQVAAELGFSHHHIPVDGHYLARYTAQAAWRAEGRLNAYASWIFAAEPFLQQGGYHRVLTGLHGNTLAGRKYPATWSLASRFEQAETALRHKIEARLAGIRRVMRPSVFAHSADESISTRLAAFRTARGSDVYARFDEMLLRQSTRHHAHREAVLGDGADPVDPFLDRDLLRFSLSLPPDLRLGGKLYRRMLVEHFPRVARLPEGRTGRSVNAWHWLDRHPHFERASQYHQRIKQKFARQPHEDHAHASVPHNAALRGGSRAFVLDLLEKTYLYDDLFDPHAVQALVGEHFERRNGEYILIGGLLTLIAWRQQVSRFVEAHP